MNRLAALSLISDAGAVLSGSFGMNVALQLKRIFFQPEAVTVPLHQPAVTAVSLPAFKALSFGLHITAANGADYRDIFQPRRALRPPGSA